MKTPPQWELSPEGLKKLQAKSLEIVLYLKQFCERNNILFYLCGGGCIGAVREGGFIPWDDDLDIMMPREHYERFYKLWQEQEKDNKKYVCLRTNDEIFTGNVFTTLVDTETTCIKRNQIDLDIPQGVVVDIFPVDGCPDNRISQLLQMMHTMIYMLFLAQVVPENHGKLMAWGSKLLLSIFRGQNIRKKIWKRAERQMTKYKLGDYKLAKDLCAGPYYMRKKYPWKTFDGSVYKSFEGEMLPVPIGYDTYLSVAFGDYMSLPPVEERTIHHDFVFCDTEKSYKEYRGVYYLLNESPNNKE